MNTNERGAHPRISSLDYAVRATDFVGKLAPNSVAVIVSNPERTRSNDTEHDYRQSSDVLYINGFPEPESAIVFTNIGGKCKCILFVRPKDREREVWTGIRVGVDGAKKSYMADEAYTIDKFESVIGKLLTKADHVYYRFGNNDELDKKFTAVWQVEQKSLLNPETILHEMRLFKSEAELAMLRRAGDISAQAHCTAASRLVPGLMEYQLKATLEYVFTESGAQAPAYGTIVASGNNACVLHYTTNREQIQDGDLVLIDAACELDGYASDITRTFPANGKFSDAQREIYQLVLDAQMAAIRMAKPGKSMRQVHGAAAKVLRLGLVKLGILPAEMANSRSAKRIYRAAKKEGKDAEKTLLMLGSFFMHGTSHYMGLDVHDVGMTNAKGMHKDRKLEPGMVFTVEPGLYIDKNDKRVAAKYRGIGVRIEDDIVVTADGCEVLTAGVPKSIAEIETLMADAATRR